jgi:hypothetical protein
LPTCMCRMAWQLRRGGEILRPRGPAKIAALIVRTEQFAPVSPEAIGWVRYRVLTGLPRGSGGQKNVRASAEFDVG